MYQRPPHHPYHPPTKGLTHTILHELPIAMANAQTFVLKVMIRLFVYTMQSLVNLIEIIRQKMCSKIWPPQFEIPLSALASTFLTYCVWLILRKY